MFLRFKLVMLVLHSPTVCFLLVPELSRLLWFLHCNISEPGWSCGFWSWNFKSILGESIRYLKKSIKKDGVEIKNLVLAYFASKRFFQGKIHFSHPFFTCGAAEKLSATKRYARTSSIGICQRTKFFPLFPISHFWFLWLGKSVFCRFLPLRNDKYNLKLVFRFLHLSCISCTAKRFF